MDQASYWHRHLILARKLSILRIDERLRDLATNGTKELLFSQGGEPIWQVDPALAADALDPKSGRIVAVIGPSPTYKARARRRIAGGISGSAAEPTNVDQSGLGVAA